MKYQLDTIFYHKPHQKFKTIAFFWLIFVYTDTKICTTQNLKYNYNIVDDIILKYQKNIL